MTEKLASGDAFRLANDEVEHYQAQNARAKKAQQAREAEQAERDAGLQAQLRQEMYARMTARKEPS
jgi:hypothetical protein